HEEIHELGQLQRHRRARNLADPRQNFIRIVSLLERVFGFLRILLVGVESDPLEITTKLFEVSCNRRAYRFRFSQLLLGMLAQPSCVLAETVHPVSGLNENLHETVETEACEEFCNLCVAISNLNPESIDCGFACKIEAPLFIENRERWIDAGMEA